MTDRMLDRLLAGRLRDPDGGGVLSIDIASIVIGTHLAEAAPDLLAPLGLGPRIALVADPDTHHAMGEHIAARLPAADVVMLTPHPHPDMDAVSHVRARSTAASGLVAVGSGSINDIVKYAAHLDGKPYAVFGTAPSMNGYASVSAAITENGLKKSLPARLPRGVFLDLDVLAAAPPRLRAAGFGDSMARATAQVDWLAAHLLLAKPYRDAPFILLSQAEAPMIAAAGRIAAGDRDAIRLLTETLVLSGCGMTICGGSNPASQGEHLIAHYLDMRGRDLPEAFHGEHIAVTTLSMARLQAGILAAPALWLSPPVETEARFVARFGEALGHECWQAYRPKILAEAEVAALNARLAADWPAMRRRLAAVALPAAAIHEALVAVGAPTTPADVGIPPAVYGEAVARARLIRDRYTALDIAAATGLLPDDPP
jgi:glycerol-1-phosphate dehydrogenase [NAD(P)+]